MRGMHQIRSSAGKLTRAAVSKQSKDYQLFMQITCLEMEKVRRGVERAAALTRVQRIDARLNEVEAEKAMLMSKLSERGAGLAALAHAVSGPDTTAASLSRESAPGAFHIRY